MYKIGEINELKVARKSDLGYMLKDSDSEVLLHFKESFKEYAVDDIVKVFIYFDSKGRAAATTNMPNATLENPGFCKVVEVVSNLGVFIDNNAAKDVLIPLDYLPYDKMMWPDVDDTVLVRLKLKKNSFIAKPLNRFEIIELKSQKAYEKDDTVSGYVIRPGVEGVGIVSTDFNYIFVHKTHLRRVYRLGENVTPKIIMVKKDEYNGSLIQNKEFMIDTDEEIILNYLRSHDGVMSLSAKSSSDDVLNTLKISRKAFKRALGALYKSHKVICEEDRTILNKEI